MKAAIKSLLTASGYVVQRLPAGLPTGHHLARDLRIVVGGQPGSVCIDVGAHVGDFVDLLRGALPAPVIHAFEPAPEPFARLRARHATTPGVHLVAAGLSDQPGQLEFNIYDNQTLNSFLPLAPGADRTFGGATQVSQVKVQVLRLDDYATGTGLDRIALLKIDTQGFERHVLRGAEQLLKAGRVRAVLVELNFVPLYAGQVWAHELIAHLHERGLYLVDFYEKCRLNPFLGWCTALFAHRDAGPVK
jgi:FkbM family methyltransferase